MTEMNNMPPPARNVPTSKEEYKRHLLCIMEVNNLTIDGLAIRLGWTKDKIETLLKEYDGNV